MTKKDSLSINKWGGIAVPIVLTLIIVGASWYFWDWLVASSTAETTTGAAATVSSTNSDTLRNIVLIIVGIWVVYTLYCHTKGQDNENAILNKITIHIPIGLTLCVVLACIALWPDKADVSVISDLVLAFGGVWAFYGIIIAARRTAALEKQTTSLEKQATALEQQIKIQERGQISESIGRAAEQLSSEAISIRILAILSLEKIALNGDIQICEDIIKTLCAHIRNKRPAKNDKTAEQRKSEETSPPEDINHIMSALSNINLQKSTITLDLSNINFTDISVSGLYLAGANLRNADLSGADLSGADLSDAILLVANLSGADLQDVEGLDTAIGLETAIGLKTIINPPPEILAEIER